MLVKSLHLTNFGPFESLRLEGLDELVVLVGANGSGKSFILDALYKVLQEFELTGGASSWAGNLDYWHKRDSKNPIGIELEIKLSERERMGLARERSVDDILASTIHVVLSRSLKFSENWITERLEVFGEALIEKDVATSSLAHYATEKLKPLFAAAMRMLPATADGTPTGDRVASPSGAMSELTRVASSRQPPDERRFDEAREELNTLLKKQLETRGSELLFQDSSRKGPRLPSQNLGRGERAVVDFYWHTLEQDLILSVDEPEAHLHPPLARDVFRLLKTKGQRSGGQAWIATHSPMMLDTVELTNNWLIERGLEASSIKRLSERADLSLALSELGVLAGDIFMADFLLLVEGETERQAFPVLAAKLGYDLETRIRIVPVGGGSQAVNYLRILLALLRESPTKYMIVLDSGTNPTKSQLIEEFSISEECVVAWSKPCFEDFYPGELVRQGLKELFGVDSSEAKLTAERMDKQIEKLLKGRPPSKGWKVALASYVASHMAADDVPKELAEVLRQVDASLG